MIQQRDFFDKDIANSKNIDGYYIIERGDFVYNPRISKEAPFGPVNQYKYKEPGVVSPLYLCFKSRDVNIHFLGRYFKSDKWYRHIYLNGDTGARHDRVSIKDSDFFKTPITVPTGKEQQKIADFFTLLDQKIEKQQQKIEHLERYKKGIMQQLFSQNSKVAQLRFPEFSGELEEVILENLGDFHRTYSFSRSEEGVGEYKHIHYGDIHMKFNGIVSMHSSIPSIVATSESGFEIVRDRDVIFADASEDLKDLGKVAVVENIGGNKIVSGLHTYCLGQIPVWNRNIFYIIL